MNHPWGSAAAPPSDADLVARIRAGDERAFEALFRAFAPGLCALVSRYVGSPAVAEELVQDLFLALWQQRAQLSVDRSVSSYLCTAARNRALNHLRRERLAQRWRHEATPPERVPVADSASPTEGELLELLELQDAIGQLPARCRLIFTLNRQQEMTYGEIAASLGLSIKTVETQMGRALKALRARLQHLRL